jgi:hypothetical protein
MESLSCLISLTEVHGLMSKIGSVVSDLLTIRMEEITRYAHESVTKMIVGTKADLKDKAKVTKREVIEFCEPLGLDYIFISSKEDKNVNEMVYLLAEKIRQKAVNNLLPTPLPRQQPPKQAPKTRECTTM